MASSQTRNSFLTEKDVREATQTMSVGGVPGLRVTVQTSSSGRIIRSYTLRLTINGKRTQRGLGGVDEITLSQARMKAQQILDDTTDGKETRVCIPKTERIEPAKVLTVEELFTAWQSVQVSRGRWKGPEKTVRDDKARLYRYLSSFFSRDCQKNGIRFLAPGTLSQTLGYLFTKVDRLAFVLLLDQFRVLYTC